jgi:hypothetical protein
MAGSNSIRACATCGHSIAPTGRKGPPRRYCNTACRQQGRVDAKAALGQCSIPECSSAAYAKSMCSMHYSRLRVHGDPLHFGRPQRIDKPCGWCGASMHLRPSTAKVQVYCSQKCGQTGRALREGKRLTATAITCRGCARQIVRRVRNTRDAGEYCGRDCYSAWKKRISAEKESLRAIASNWRLPQPKDDRLLHEIAAIKRIARWTPGRRPTVRPCMRCSRKCVGLGEMRRTCAACKRLVKRESAKKTRKTEAHKARRRVDKARRRAIERGQEAERIDPIKVFDRDHWRCHLCGGSAPRRLRGTYADQAPELDHVTPLAAGGTHTWGNVKCACRKCNGLKADKPLGQLGFDMAA